jgi:membrane-bound serine protease (ClpP class)
VTAVILLFAVGIVLLAADVFVASFLLAALGGAVMLVGCVVAYQALGAGAAGLATLAAVGLLGATVYLELIVLPRTRFGRDLVVQAKVDATSQPPVAPAESVVGRPAEALTTLAPSGYVAVDGRRYEAFCQSGHAAKGATLRVVGVDNFRLIVSISNT